MKLLDLIYKNGNTKLFLERKFEMYLLMKEIMVRPKKKRTYMENKEFFFKSPDKRIYSVKNLAKFSLKHGFHRTYFSQLARSKRISPRPYWTNATPEEIESSIKNNTLITASPS